jgi:hypothetical protein
VTGRADTRIKSSARWAFQKASAVYQVDRTNQTSPSESVELLNRKFGPMGLKRSLHPQRAARMGWTPVLPAYPASDFPKLLERVKQIHSVRGHVSRNGPSATADRTHTNRIASRLQGEQS